MNLKFWDYWCFRNLSFVGVLSVFIFLGCVVNLDFWDYRCFRDRPFIGVLNFCVFCFLAAMPSLVYAMVCIVNLRPEQYEHSCCSANDLRGRGCLFGLWR